MAIAKDTKFKKGMTPWNKDNKIVKVCTICVSSFSGRGIKYCSMQCAGKARLGMVFSENLGRKKGCLPYNKGKKYPEFSGVNNWRWIEDRTLLKRYEGSEEKRSPAYKSWRKEVCDRDGFTCRIADNNCDGRLEVHHILSWSKFLELRYAINNGITLCHFHHPRKRVDEIKLSPYFQSLVMSNSN